MFQLLKDKQDKYFRIQGKTSFFEKGKSVSTMVLNHLSNDELWYKGDPTYLFSFVISILTFLQDGGERSKGWSLLWHVQEIVCPSIQKKFPWVLDVLLGLSTSSGQILIGMAPCTTNQC